MTEPSIFSIIFYENNRDDMVITPPTWEVIRVVAVLSWRVADVVGPSH
jgi:hypothetical protein